MINNLIAMAQQPGQESNPLTMFLPLVLMGAVFYFMIIRPQSKRQKEREKMLSAVQKGDKVVTTGGLHGTVSSVEEATIIVQVAENVKLKFDKNAVTVISQSKSSDSSVTTK